MALIIKQVINRKGEHRDGMKMTHRLNMVKEHFDIMVEEGAYFYGNDEYAECRNIQDVLKLWGAPEVERLYQLIQRESTVDSEVF